MTAIYDHIYSQPSNHPKTGPNGAFATALGYHPISCLAG